LENEKKNGATVVPFAKPQPAANENDNTPPAPRKITFTFMNDTVRVQTGLLVFMNPYIGVGQQDGTVTFLANPVEVRCIELADLA